MGPEPWTLLYSTTSPYSRKVLVLISERSLHDQVALKVVLPFEDPPELISHGGVGKVPVLVGKGQSIFDSRVISDFLDSVSTQPQGLHGEAMWTDRTRVALGDAIMDAAVALVMEGRREDSEQSPALRERQTARIRRIVHSLAPGFGAELSLGDMAVACALSYLDFRLPELDWKLGSEPLAHWYQSVEGRKSFASNLLG